MIRVSSIREAYGYRTEALEASFRRKLAKISERAEIGRAVAEGVEDIARTTARSAIRTYEPQRAVASQPATEGAKQILSAYSLY